MLLPEHSRACAVGTSRLRAPVALQRFIARPAVLVAEVCPLWVSCTCMRYRLRFLWNATKGHRLAPWRSPYLLWRIETYTGVKMKEIGFLEFWEFMWRERNELWRFLCWTGEMERWVQPKPKV
jgi:hypothetical protein